jgi:hypothetical protein
VQNSFLCNWQTLFITYLKVQTCHWIDNHTVIRLFCLRFKEAFRQSSFLKRIRQKFYFFRDTKGFTWEYTTACTHSVYYQLLHTIYLSYIYLGYFVCVCVCVCVTICVGTLCYSYSFNNQTDQGDETEGMKREGLKMEG